jgi:hypothetical protein
MTRVILSIYSLLLRAYPTSFRTEFETEMGGVFGNSLADAESEGPGALVSLCWRELRDWPVCLWAEHWRNVQLRGTEFIEELFKVVHKVSANNGNRRQSAMDTSPNNTWTVEDKRTSIVAALPPLLAGLGIGLLWLIIGGPWNTVPSWRLYLGAAVGLFPFAVLGLGGALAIVRRLPDWGYSWVGGAMMGFALFIKTLAEEGAEVGRQYLISQAGDAALLVFVLLAGFVVLVVAASRGWAQSSLVSIGLSSLMWLSLFAAVAGGPFHRYGLAISAIPLGLVAAGLTYAYVRGSDKTRLAILAAMGMMNVGAVLVVNSVWASWLTPQGRQPPLIPLLVLSTGILIAGPVLGLLVRPLSKNLSKV